LGAADGLTFGLLAHSYAMSEQYVAAESAYRQAMMLQPESADWKSGLARCLFKERKFEEAAALCGDMIRREPARADLWLLQANAWLSLKQPLKAAENYELLDRAGLANVACLNTLGDIYVNENVPELAVSAYQRALAKDGENADPAVPLRNAEVLVSRSAYTEASSLLGRVKDVCGTKLGTQEKKRVLKLEARIAAASGQSGAEQAKLLEDIIALDPLDGEAIILLAQHYSRTGDTDKACFMCERAAGIEKYEAEAKLRHGQILVKGGKYLEALPLLKRAQELKPRDDVQKYVEQVERAARSKNG
jgi:Tfp pilus assembly protein PilF